MVQKKAIDTWKTKVWYSIRAPKFLDEKEITQIPAQDEEKLLNRIIIIPLKDISGNTMHTFTDVKLRVFEIKGKTAYTKFIGHEVSREYLKSMVRHGRDVINVIFPTKSLDGVEFTIKAILVTENKCSNVQKRSLHNALKQLLTEKAEKTEFSKFIQEAIYGKAANELFQKMRKIAPVKKIEIRKTVLKEEFDVEEVEKEEEAKEAEAEEKEDEAEEEAEKTEEEQEEEKQ